MKLGKPNRSRKPSRQTSRDQLAKLLTKRRGTRGGSVPDSDAKTHDRDAAHDAENGLARITKSKWAVPVITGVVGLFIGTLAAQGSDASDSACEVSTVTKMPSAEVEALETQLADVTSERDQLEEERDGLQEQVAGIESASAKVSELEERVTGLEGNVDSLTSERDSCQAELATTQSSLEAAQNEAAAAAAGNNTVPQGFVGSAGNNAPSNVYYANCSEARAAGAAPLYSGEPGYRSALDRDNDGVACE